MIGEDTAVSLSFVALVFGSCAGLWWRIETKFNRAGDDRARLERALHQSELNTAQNYMSKQSAGAALDRMVEELRGLRTDIKDDLAKLDNRIARVETHMLGQAGN